MAGSAVLGTNLVDSLIPDVIDGLRADLHPAFGVRPYRVATVKRVWAGATEGEGPFTDTEVEIDPQPRVARWDGLEYQLTTNGLNDQGEVRVTEVSLTYTHAELEGGSLAANERWFIKITDAHGQGNPARYFTHARPPFVDREQDMGWVLWLKPVDVDGCSP